MAGRRLSMRKIKEVLRLKWQHGHSKKQIAQSCKIARSTVKDYLSRAQKAGLNWPLDPALDDGDLETRPGGRP
jgi:DNA-binding transcriptional regulator LsrR (DeoR family)